MKGTLLWVATLFLALGTAVSVVAQQETRLVRGQVLDEKGKVVESAIVHLKNLNSKETLSVVTDKEGRYRFNDVDKKVDYEIYAEWRAQKSRTRKVSQFDTRTIITINLPLEPPEDSGEEEKSGQSKQEPR